jgi:hypothetical protein
VESNCETVEFFTSYNEKRIKSTIIISNTSFELLGNIFRKNNVKKSVSKMVKTLVDNEAELKFVVKKLFK